VFDILIKNGTLIDGSGKPARRADVGITDGRVHAIKESLSESARRVINAEGKIVSPGFIDIQNHSDSYGALLQTPSLESLLHQGITTILVGHAGSSLAPLLSGSLVSIRKWKDTAGVNVGWKSVDEFLSVVEERGIGPHVATLIGHSTLRRDLIGDSGRTLNAKERDQMKSLLRRGMREGGWGLSFGLEYAHERATEEDELVQLMQLVKERNGVVSLHLRNEGPEFFNALTEAVALMKKSGVRAKIARFKIEMEQDAQFAQQAIEILEKSRAGGIDVFIDVYPYTVSASALYLLLPSWATDGGRRELLEKLSNEALRKEIISEMQASHYPYDKIRIASGNMDRTIMGKSIALLERNYGSKGPEEVILDLIIASEDQIIVFFENIYEELFETFLRWPYTMLATNGVGYARERAKSMRELPHPRSYGTTARILGTYVRERKLISLEEAVYKMSGLPASFLGLRGRGILSKGGWADVVVFDAHTIEDRATFENPFLYPRGIEYVLVNGVSVIEHGEYTGSKPGSILRHT
jgi:N-acyl-D-amino-acid deacylase